MLLHSISQIISTVINFKKDSQLIFIVMASGELSNTFSSLQLTHHALKPLAAMQTASFEAIYLQSSGFRDP
jgi:hypothetical protein